MINLEEPIPKQTIETLKDDVRIWCQNFHKSQEGIEKRDKDIEHLNRRCLELNREINRLKAIPRWVKWIAHIKEGPRDRWDD